MRFSLKKGDHGKHTQESDHNKHMGGSDCVFTTLATVFL